jgi:transcriptional regulator with XRE-family HTH domain
MLTLRKTLGMSQEEFGRLIGVSYMTVRRWELGWGHFPKTEHAFKLEHIALDHGGLKPWNMKWKRGIKHGNDSTV